MADYLLSFQQTFFSFFAFLLTYIYVFNLLRMKQKYSKQEGDYENPRN